MIKKSEDTRSTCTYIGMIMFLSVSILAIGVWTLYVSTDHCYHFQNSGKIVGLLITVIYLGQGMIFV